MFILCSQNTYLSVYNEYLLVRYWWVCNGCFKRITIEPRKRTERIHRQIKKRNCHWYWRKKKIARKNRIEIKKKIIESPIISFFITVWTKFCVICQLYYNTRINILYKNMRMSYGQFQFAKIIYIHSGAFEFSRHNFILYYTIVLL